MKLTRAKFEALVEDHLVQEDHRAVPAGDERTPV